MSAPHPPTSGVGATRQQAEPAWNPGGKNLSYINKTGRGKFGFIGVLLRISSASEIDCSGHADYQFRARDVADIPNEVEEGVN
jgi:hypothetical protein